MLSHDFPLRLVELFVTPKSHKCFTFDGVAQRKTGQDQKQESEAEAGAAFSNQKIEKELLQS